MSKQFNFKPQGVCSQEMKFSLVEGKVKNLEIFRGCTGNLQGLIRLVDGMEATEVISKLRGIPCRGTTSCPDQLALALEQALKSQE